MKANVLVLGGSGFVGSALVPALLQLGCTVTLLNRGFRHVAGVHQITMDRFDATAVKSVGARFDVVIDTSSYNAEATRIAYGALGGASTLWLHLSSAAVYRAIGKSGALESDELGGADVWGEYGREKHAAETALMEAANGPFVIVRPPYLYGPKNNNDRETFIWARVLSGRPVIVPGTGDAQIQFLHVEDLASLFVHFVKTPPDGPRLYNVAAPEIVTSCEWAKRLAAIASCDIKVFWGRDVAPGTSPRDYFPFRDADCAVNANQLFATTSWRPQFDFQTGFAATFGSYSVSDLIQASPSTIAEKAILSERPGQTAR